MARRLSPTPQYFGRATTPDARIAIRITPRRNAGRANPAPSRAWIRTATFSESTIT